ncbi:unnamed protein product, partial [Pleuronectes platessa]
RLLLIANDVGQQAFCTTCWCNQAKASQTAPRINGGQPRTPPGILHAADPLRDGKRRKAPLLRPHLCDVPCRPPWLRIGDQLAIRLYVRDPLRTVDLLPATARSAHHGS